MVGDTPWSIFTAITKADAEAYLEDRRQRGFNAIIVNIIEHFFNGPVNRDGQAPFTKTGAVYDFSKPNDAYFAHVDYVLGLARDKGMLVLMTPAYLGFGGGSEGWWPEINTSVNTEAVMENYGRYLGNRYKAFNNVIWVMGGDYYTAATLAKTRAIVRGIQATDQPRLFTAHNARQESGLLYYTNETWFTVNTTYSDCTLTPQRLIEDYQRARVMPFVYFEGRYENEGASAVCLRSQAYWPVLLGAVGAYFGNAPIWNFNVGWQAALGSEGARSMTYFRKLVLSRAWDKLVPDTAGTVLTAGPRRARRRLCGRRPHLRRRQHHRVCAVAARADDRHEQGHGHYGACVVVQPVDRDRLPDRRFSDLGGTQLHSSHRGRLGARHRRRRHGTCRAGPVGRSDGGGLSAAKVGDEVLHGNLLDGSAEPHVRAGTVDLAPFRMVRHRRWLTPGCRQRADRMWRRRRVRRRRACRRPGTYRSGQSTSNP